MDSRYSPLVLCPLCGDEHETKIARNGRPYFNCELWMNRLFGNSQVSLAIFGNNGGPVPAPRPRRSRANPPTENQEPTEGESPASDSRRTWPSKVCGAAIPEDSPRCPGCGDEVVWE